RARNEGDVASKLRVALKGGGMRQWERPAGECSVQVHELSVLIVGESWIRIVVELHEPASVYRVVSNAGSILAAAGGDQDNVPQQGAGCRIDAATVDVSVVVVPGHEELVWRARGDGGIAGKRGVDGNVKIATQQ